MAGEGVIMRVHIGVIMYIHTPTSCATVYSTWPQWSRRRSWPCHAIAQHTRVRTQERDAHKITSSPTSSAHTQSRTGVGTAHAAAARTVLSRRKDSREVLRAVTPPASCWSTRLLCGCRQQTARQRTHTRHAGRAYESQPAASLPGADRHSHAHLHGRQFVRSGPGHRRTW
jgi:hypothetical protein